MKTEPTESVTRLGMTFGELYAERIGIHASFWSWAAFACTWAWLYDTTHVSSVFLGLLASLLGALIVTFIYSLICFAILPLLPLLLLAAFSTFLEARWRIHYNRPYVPPPTSHVQTSPPQPAPPQGNGGWLIPLMIGLWIGSSWGGDD